MTDSTIALIERLKARGEEADDWTTSGLNLRDLLTEAAAELTNLLQRCEKAEAENVQVRKIASNAEKYGYEQALERIKHVEAQRDEARKALEPFVRDLDNWTDDNGWTEEAPKNDRICDWFGPSDFRAARNAMEPE